jgi:hypothetical protein
MEKFYRPILYVAALVVLVSGIMARKNLPLALPTAGLVSFCIATKAGSRNPPILSAVVVGVLMALLTLIANSVGAGAVSETLATVTVVGAVALVFLRRRTKDA